MEPLLFNKKSFDLARLRLISIYVSMNSDISRPSDVYTQQYIV